MKKSIFGYLTLAFLAATIIGVSPGDSKPKPKPQALVLSVTGAKDTTLQAFDHIYTGTQVDLRPSGVLVVSYLDTCLEETITGGRVKFNEGGRKLRKGAVASSVEIVCTSGDGVVSEEEQVNFDEIQALSPFHATAWQERIIKTTQPIFQWPMGTQVPQVTLKILHLDAETALPVWQMDSAANHLIYPSDAPALVPGVPYQVEVLYPGGMSRTNVFSIDPGLQIPDSVANRLVPLDW